MKIKKCQVGCPRKTRQPVDLCSCGHPQSHPIPHEHDLSIREAAIIAYYKELNADLLEACEWIHAFISTAKDGGNAWCAVRNQPGAKDWANNLDAAVKKAKGEL